jgi:hypothetical protein
VVLAANFRVDAWVTPPAYTGKPPIILAGIHPGETARAADAAGEPVTVPAGSTLVVRATGKLHLDVAGGVTAVTEATHAPSGTEEHRFKIAATGTATLRGVGDDLTWAFNATPDKPPTIALTKDPEQQNRGAMLPVLPRRGRLRRDRSARDLRPQGRAGGEGRRSASAVRAARFLAGPATGAHQERRRAEPSRT